MKSNSFKKQALALIFILPFWCILAKDPPNIITILIDDADFTDFSCFVGPKDLTPNIDRLASEGVRFTQAYTTASACTPSRYSFLTGKYATRYFDENRPPKSKNQVATIQWNTYINKPETNIATFFNKLGFKTGISGKWHITWMKTYELPRLNPDAKITDSGMHEKLQNYQNAVASKIQELTGFQNANAMLTGNFDGAEAPPLKDLRYHNLEWITKGCVDFIKENKEKPFYFQMNQTVIHGPRVEPSLMNGNITHTPEGILPELANFQKDRIAALKKVENYDNKYRNLSSIWLDQQIGRIVDTLKQVGIFEKTVLILAPDHNIEPGKASVYESGGRIPMILFWKDKFEKNRVDDHLIQLVDVLPTTLDIIGHPLSEEELKHYKIDGRSFLPAILGTSEKEDIRKDTYAEFGYTRMIKAKIQGQEFKYVAWRYPKKDIEKMKEATKFGTPEVLSYDEIRTRSQEKELFAINHLNMPKAEQPKFTMQVYPAYYDPDQLYLVGKNNAEQFNLAFNPEYSKILQELKNRLRVYSASFDYHFDVGYTLNDPDNFISSPQYKAMTENTAQFYAELENAPKWFNTKSKAWPPTLESQFPNWENWPPQIPEIAFE